MFRECSQVKYNGAVSKRFQLYRNQGFLVSFYKRIDDSDKDLKTEGDTV